MWGDRILSLWVERWRARERREGWREERREGTARVKEGRRRHVRTICIHVQLRADKQCTTRTNAHCNPTHSTEYQLSKYTHIHTETEQLAVAACG